MKQLLHDMESFSYSPQFKETIDNIELESYKGDIINGIDFNHHHCFCYNKLFITNNSIARWLVF